MNNSKSILKSILPHLGAILFFFILVLIYFYPIFEGKVYNPFDVTKFEGSYQELKNFGEKSGWLGSMFSGMPSYQVSGYSSGFDIIEWFKVYIFQSMHPDSAGIIFAMLVTAYIFFLSIGARVWMAILGSIAATLSSFNIIIIEAGHITQAWSIVYSFLTLAGLITCLQRKYLSGFLIFALGLTWQIQANHLQIAYYVALLCAILFIAFVINTIQDKQYIEIGKAAGVLMIGVVFVVGINFSSLYINYEMGKESTRGKAELTPKGDSGQKASTGLDKNYAFMWSYGKAETFTMLIPNFMGGESGGKLGSNSHVYKALKAEGYQIGKEIQAGTYWGEKPFTSGPVYFGAIICFLFLLAFFIVPKSYKWWLLGASVFFIFMSWGKNLAWFNDFLFYHFPYYNKFRTPEMALVIPGIIFPMLSVMALKELSGENIPKEKLKKALIYSTSIAGGICLVFWLIPGMFLSFRSSFDTQLQLPDLAYSALLEDRKGLLQADALRSLIFILLSATVVFAFHKMKDRKKAILLLSIGLITLVTCDLWQIDKRYLSYSSFISKKAKEEQTFKESVADKAILQDKSPSYRVFNLNNPFKETFTSYYHKSIGGYHAAKLKRYDDLIDNRLIKEHSAIIEAFNNKPTQESIMNVLSQCSSLNMLNTKYIIFNPEQPPIENPFHNGNAWFVDSYRFVDNADQEMAALETINPRREAVLDKQFEKNLNGLQIQPDSTAKIEMTAYAPNRLKYKSVSANQGLAVLSEIYYPHDWKAYIDGKQVPISRADWILRTIVVPAGQHDIELVFEPDTLNKLGVVSTIASFTLLFLCIGAVVYVVIRKRKQEEIKG